MINDTITNFTIQGLNNVTQLTINKNLNCSDFKAIAQEFYGTRFHFGLIALITIVMLRIYLLPFIYRWMKLEQKKILFIEDRIDWVVTLLCIAVVFILYFLEISVQGRV